MGNALTGYEAIIRLFFYQMLILFLLPCIKCLHKCTTILLEKILYEWPSLKRKVRIVGWVNVVKYHMNLNPHQSPRRACFKIHENRHFVPPLAHFSMGVHPIQEVSNFGLQDEINTITNIDNNNIKLIS